jgi:DNA replication protein DnaC
MEVHDNVQERILAQTVGVCKRRGCNRGHITVEGGVRACECSLQFRRLMSWHRAGIPEDYWTKRPSDYKKVPPRLRTYLTRIGEMITNGVGLYVWGDFGTGKSGFCSEILKATIAAKKTGFFIFFPQLCDVLSNFDEVEPEVRDGVRSRVLGADLVVLDDVGREYRKDGSNWIPAQFDALFRQRLMSKRATILTSNFTFERTEKMYGSSVLSAFRGQLVEIAYSGEDFRESIQKKHERLLDGVTK